MSAYETYKLDGVVFPKNPIKTHWVQPTIATKGTGETFFIDYWSCEMEFSYLTTTEKAFFLQRKFNGGAHTAILPHPLDDSLITVTNVHIKSFETTKFDVDGYADQNKLIISHILLTGTSS